MPDKPVRPSLFIASSVEGFDVAYAVQANLEHDAQCVVWSQGVFRPTERGLDSLVRQLEATDFAVFVFTPDDTATIRSKTSAVVRDNVIFELGLFIGALKTDRCFIVRPRGDDLHLPSDTIGVSPLNYESDRPDANLQAALGPACNEIRKAIGRFGGASVRTQSDPVAQSYDDKDIVALLMCWIGTVSGIDSFVFHYDRIDTKLQLPKGSTAKFIDVAADLKNYSLRHRGSLTFGLVHVSSLPRR